jgi:hypothetical protein
MTGLLQTQWKNLLSKADVLSLSYYPKIRQCIACNTWIASLRRVTQPELSEVRKVMFPVMIDAVELLSYPHNL